MRRLIAAAAMLVWMGPLASAQERVVLRVGDTYPAGHYIAEALTKPWMEDVKARSGGRVSFEYYPASQLGPGREMLSLTQSGVVDVGIMIPSIISDRLPLSLVAELPGDASTSCQSTQAFWSLTRPGGVLAEKEYGPNGIIVLFAAALVPYQIFSRRPIETLKSLEGLKLYSPGGAKDLTVRRVGAVPIRMETADLYQAMTRGTIDGALISYGSILAYHLPGLIHAATFGENLGTGVIAYGISRTRWDKLSVDIQSALAGAGEAATRRACASFDAGVSGDVAKLQQDGVALVRLQDDDRAALAKATAGVASEWAAELDHRGKSGSEVLAAFHKALPPP